MQFGNPELQSLSDEELLDLRFCDLNLKIEGTPLEHRIAQLTHELEARKIRFRPHFWLSEEWFTPDGIPGIAIPFFLADRRLMQLERSVMLEIEGGTPDSCMRILRHEVGHAIDNAYRLRRRRAYREVFGNVAIPYPTAYNPKPYSRRYVVNIGLWYAQAHPVEDFAETFAVWLRPRSRWRTVYADWPALKKLEFVDQLIREIRSETPIVRSKRHEEPLRSIRRTLREHYERKRDHYGLDAVHEYDHDLRKLFSDDPDSDGASAAGFLRRIRPRIRRAVADWTGQYQYTIDQVLAEMILRCRSLGLKLEKPEDVAERDALIVLTMRTMDYIHSDAHKIAL